MPELLKVKKISSSLENYLNSQPNGSMFSDIVDNSKDIYRVDGFVSDDGSEGSAICQAAIGVWQYKMRDGQ